jgi:hypothetical protein
MKAINRLYKYIDYKGIKAIPFEKKVGLSNGYLGKQLKREADLGEGILIKIIENCPDLSPEWLLIGEGSMLKNNLTTITSEVDHHYKELAEARLDIIDGLKFKIASLEKSLSELKHTPQNTFLHSNVAEPTSELIKKESK